MIDKETPASEWKTLYKAGGIAALVMALFIPVQSIVFILWPPPADVPGWFALFLDNRLIGLLDMDLLLITDQALMILVILALFIVLRHISRSWMTIALALGLVGIAAYWASTGAFEMLSLSNKYAVATTPEEKNILLAAGQVVMNTWMGTAFDVSYVLEAITLLIISFVMLRSNVFSRTIAWFGIVMSVLMIVPPSAGPVGLTMSLASLIPLEVWTILVGVRLLKL